MKLIKRLFKQWATVIILCLTITMTTMTMACGQKPVANSNVSPPVPPSTNIEASTRRSVILNLDRGASAVEDFIVLKRALRRDNLIQAATERTINDLLLKINTVILEAGKLAQANPNFDISGVGPMASLARDLVNTAKALSDRNLFGDLAPATRQRINAVADVILVVAQSLAGLLGEGV